MKACVLHAVDDLRCEEVQRPAPKADEVLVRVGACGVCGSDIPRVFSKGTYSFPIIPGHEFAGEVVETGDEAGADFLGKRVVVFPLIPCRRCAACKARAYAQCTDYDYLGSRCDGAFAEYVVAPAWNLLPIPDGVSMESAAMTEPAAVALHAVEQGGVQQGEDVLVVGAGPIGLMVAQWARIRGAAHVALVDIDAAKVSFAQSLGYTATDTVDGEFDCVVEASGSAAGLTTGLHAAKPFGRVVALGNPAGPMTLDQEAYWAVMRKELRVIGSWNSRFDPDGEDDWRRVLGAMASGALDVAPLISHRVGLDGLLDAMIPMRNRTEFSNKVMYVNGSDHD
jgi:L-iditol 2-dehydrogenase